MTSETLSDDQIRTRAGTIATSMAHLEGPMLPILHALQEEFGYVPEAALPVVGEILNVTRAEVHGVVSFYPDFRRTPGGPHTLRLCRAEACQSRGADALVAEAKEVLGADFSETTPDGAINVEQVFCLGLCAIGPAAMLDDKVIGRMDRAKLEAIKQEASA